MSTAETGLFSSVSIRCDQVAAGNVLVATVTRYGGSVVVPSVTHLVAVLSQAILRNEAAVVGHQKAGINVEG